MAINRIYNDKEVYEVGEEEVSKIELTEHSDKKTTIYKVIYESGDYLFVGLIDHEVEHVEETEQTTIFEFLQEVRL